MVRRRRSFRGALALLTLLAGASLVSADPGHVSEYDGGEVRLKVDINIDEGALVSGTNVGLLASATEGADVGDSPDEPSEPVHARVKGCKLVLAGTVVASYGSLATASGSGGAALPPPPSGGGLPGGTPVVGPVIIRFASTHFADGASIVVTMTAEFERQSRQYSGTGIYDLPTRTVTATRTLAAYNKLQTLGTGVDQNGNSQVWYTNASDKAHAAAKGALQPSHPTQPSTAVDSRSQSGPDVLTLLATSTAMSALAHGSDIGFGDSALDDFLYFGSDVAYTVALRSTPDYNLVGFWSCKTLIPNDEWSSDSVIGFDVAFHLDRGYAGFNFSPAIRLWPGSAWTGDPPQPSGLQPNDVGDHAAEFWNWISLGRTLSFALDRANDAYPPVVGGGTSNLIETQNMIWIGDPRTKLIGVYLTQAEEDALIVAGKDPYMTWWIKL